MNNVELLENLIETAKTISYHNKDAFDMVAKRTDMIVRKLFGNDSHYLKDLSSISYSPLIFFGDSSDDDFKRPFESGLKQFINILHVMLEDVKFSSNYDNPSTQQIKVEDAKSIKSQSFKIIKVIIASPSDVVRERELLMDKLETKFRRDGNEEKCGARLIVDGWENVASQSGYAQDIINNILISKADIIVAIFRHKLGSPTKDLTTGTQRSNSGTAEEILYAIRNKSVENPPLGMAYFYATAPVVSFDAIDYDNQKSEWDRLKEFKKEIEDDILYKQYNIEEQIIEIVSRDICNNIIKYFS